MENNNFGNNIDKVLSERLGNYEVVPNSYNWSVIESKLYRDFKKNDSSPLLYGKFAAILLATICFSVFATKYFTESSNIDKKNNASTIVVPNDDAFWSYFQSITQSPEIITKEIPIIKEITKVEYVYNKDFYRMPPAYKYQPANGEQVFSYEDIKRMLALYDGERVPDNNAIANNNMPNDRTAFKEIAGIGRIENNLYNTDIDNPLPFLIHPVYGFNNDLSLSLNGGGGSLEDSKALTQKGINNALKQKLVKRTGFHFGFGGSALNTWVLNNEPTEIETNTVMYPVTLGYQYGGNVGFDFSTKFGVELGIYKANQGQKIAQIINLKKIETELRMDYVHFPLTFKYKWEQYSNLTKNPIILNYIFGLQYSRMQGYESTVNEGIISKNSIERTQDIGFLMGLEYDIFLNKNYYLTLGARSVYAYDVNEVASAFNETTTNSKANNFTVGLNASINYLIPNK